MGEAWGGLGKLGEWRIVANKQEGRGLKNAHFLATQGLVGLLSEARGHGAYPLLHVLDPKGYLPLQYQALRSLDEGDINLVSSTHSQAFHGSLNFFYTK